MTPEQLQANVASMQAAVEAAPWAQDPGAWVRAMGTLPLGALNTYDQRDAASWTAARRAQERLRGLATVLSNGNADLVSCESEWNAIVADWESARSSYYNWPGVISAALGTDAEQSINDAASGISGAVGDAVGGLQALVSGAADAADSTATILKYAPYVAVALFVAWLVWQAKLRGKV